MLGLDTSNIDKARSSYNDPGLFELAGQYLNADKSLPSLSQILEGTAAQRRMSQLPEPLLGWMRQTSEIDLIDLAEFDDGFFPGSQERIKQQILDHFEDESGKGARQVTLDNMRQEGLEIAGGYYFREEMRLLVTITSLPETPGWLSNQIIRNTTIGYTDGGVVAFNGANLSVKRHARSGYGLVQTMIGDRLMVQLRGDVPNEIFEAYLSEFDLEKLASL